MKFIDVQEFISWVQVQKRFSKKVSLDKMKYYCNLFNNPQDKFKSIHVTGTNGKGSTVAMLKNILIKKGLHIATYTSPYITCFNERITYDNQYISDDELLKYANLILSKYRQIEKDGYELPTFFEFITLVAFLYFSNLDDLDLAIVEVGMGGRLDATNVITPLLSIITNVAFDHMQVLGNTLEEILGEKLGIVKEKIPFICGIDTTDLQNICLDVAKHKDTIVIFPAFDKVKVQKVAIDYSLFSYENFKDIRLNLAGFHQIHNALVVIEAFKLLKDILKNYDITLIDDDLYIGLSDVTWVGRLEMISKNPLILLDGGHNIDGVNSICRFVKSLPYSKKRAIVAISHDKELTNMIHLIDQTFTEIIFVQYTYARSAKASELYQISKAKNKKYEESLERAIEEVYQKPVDFTIFFGSLYLVSEIRNLLKRKSDM